MATFIDDETREELRGIFDALVHPVHLVLFVEDHACAHCREQRTLLEELTTLSDKLDLEVKDLVRDSELAHAYQVSRVPATVVVGERDHGIHFLGVTAGYEFTSLIEAITRVSSERSALEPELERLAGLITAPLHLEVMVTLSCPYCPRMVQLAHQLALVNDLIRADMVDAAEFPDLTRRYDVSGVPRTVINERPSFEGALPPLQAIVEILKVANPSAYEEYDARARESRGERRVRSLSQKHRYELLIVGAGPAAMSATVYAARKGLDIAVIGDHVGGQITDTALIENWLGVPEITGVELTEAFRDHAERYPVAERISTAVTQISQRDGGFQVQTSDGTRYRATTVVYCAGKQYRRLGLPGESRFIGHGIAFCATCDAPLYREKRVAIIGGGNSAFTAARDLLPFADEVHLANILPDWQADRALFDEVVADPRVTLHPAVEVREYLGASRLEGVRLEAGGGSERFDLAVDGVFLEIGLEPNSEPVRGLLTLNAEGEVPIERDQSTAIPGFFAAGDVTDEPEKQIIVAAAAGARAALAAHRFLLERRAQWDKPGLAAAAAEHLLAEARERNGAVRERAERGAAVQRA